LPQGKVSLANGEESAVLELIPTRASEAHAADMIKTNLLRRARWATASLLLAGSVGAGTLLTGAGTASAPEPAKLVGTTALSYNGQVGPGSYVSSGQSTTILRWPASAQQNANGTPVAGTPCSTTYLAPGSTTTRVIHAVGSSRLCY
jgi:hypothetical protein